MLSMYRTGPNSLRSNRTYGPHPWLAATVLAKRYLAIGELGGYGSHSQKDDWACARSHGGRGKDVAPSVSDCTTRFDR